MNATHRYDVIARTLRLPIVGPTTRMLRAKFGSPRLTDFDSPSVDAMPDGAFARLFVEHDGRQISKWVHYFSIYDQLLGDYRSGFTEPDGTRRPLRFLEIGVSYGGSLEIWREYFGDAAVIVGIDIDPRCADPTRPDLDIRIGSQTDHDFLRSVVADMGGVDIVLDDGSHVASHQRASIEALFPRVAQGGLYICEDVHTAYSPGWLEGGYGRPDSFIGLTRGLIDDLHTAWHRRPATAPWAAGQFDAIHVHDSVVVIEKREKGRLLHGKVGTPAW